MSDHPTLPAPTGHDIHPRIRGRLEETWRRRLAAYEAARCAAWSNVADILARMARFSGGLGRGPTTLEAECLAVLKVLDAQSASQLPTPAAMAATVERLHGIADMAEDLGAALRREEAEG